MSIYTKTGDNGETMLQDGKRVPKHHLIVQALAALDEVNSHIGVIKSRAEAALMRECGQIQRNIMTIMSLLSTTSEKRPPAYGHFGAGWQDYFIDETENLESLIDTINAAMPPVKSFVTYGGCQQSAIIDLARAVTRRAETSLTQAAVKTEYAQAAFAYINRLSDFLYVKARYADFEHAVVRAVEDALHPAGQPDAPLGELNLAAAKALLEKIEHKAKSANLAVVAACCSAEGNPLAVHVMDGALLISYEAAISKAYTAAALKMPTAELNKLVQPGQPFFGLESLGGGKLLPIAGGVPVYDRLGKLIGAVGVSGGTAEEDHELAAMIS